MSHRRIYYTAAQRAEVWDRWPGRPTAAAWIAMVTATASIPTSAEDD